MLLLVSWWSPCSPLTVCVCVYGWLSLCAALQSLSSRCVCVREAGRREDGGGREAGSLGVSQSLSLSLRVAERHGGAVRGEEA